MSDKLEFMEVKMEIVDGKKYIEQVRNLIIEYVQWLDRDLSFQEIDEELVLLFEMLELDVLLDEIVELDETELITKDEELIVDELLYEEELIVDELLYEEELEVFSKAQEARIVHKNKAESKLIFFIFLLFVI